MAIDRGLKQVPPTPGGVVNGVGAQALPYPGDPIPKSDIFATQQTINDINRTRDTCIRRVNRIRSVSDAFKRTVELEAAMTAELAIRAFLRISARGDDYVPAIYYSSIGLGNLASGGGSSV